MPYMVLKKELVGGLHFNVGCEVSIPIYFVTHACLCVSVSECVCLCVHAFMLVFCLDMFLIPAVIRGHVGRKRVRKLRDNAARERTAVAEYLMRVPENMIRTGKRMQAIMAADFKRPKGENPSLFALSSACACEKNKYCINTSVKRISMVDWASSLRRRTAEALVWKPGILVLSRESDVFPLHSHCRSE